jgi:hypothetical protein
MFFQAHESLVLGSTYTLTITSIVEDSMKTIVMREVTTRDYSKRIEN